MRKDSSVKIKCGLLNKQKPRIWRHRRSPKESAKRKTGKGLDTDLRGGWRRGRWGIATRKVSTVKA